LQKRTNVADWFYAPSWKRAVAYCPPASASDDPSLGPWLLFLDEAGLGVQAEKALAAQGQRFVSVRAGKGFQKFADGSYTIAPGDRRDYDLLLQALESTGKLPRSIMHLWNVSDDADFSTAGGRDFCFYSLLYLAQAWGELGGGRSLDLLVVANGLQAVCSDRELRQPAKALVLGPCKVIPQEYPGIVCRCVDVAVPEDDGAQVAESLLVELTRPAPIGMVAYRQGYRWEQIFESVQLPEMPAGKELRHRGVYLITGGLGGIGLTLARYLAEAVQARLILLGRSAMPPPADWDAWLAANAETDSTSEKIRQLRELEALGAEVMVVTADVCNHAAMRQALDHARQRFGRIDGAIHSAGVARGGLMQLTTAEMAEPVLAPKVEGTLILESLLQEDKPDFLLLCSSINALNGGVGAVDYCSANAFLDMFALSRGGRDVSAVTSVNWDTWQQVGMALKTRVPANLREARLRALESGIAPLEGVQAFRQVLAAKLPQVAVITRDLRTILEQARQAPDRLSPDEAAPPQITNQARAHARPDTATAYQKPETDTQQKIAEIWQEVLGIHEIGIDDNFFALGGHSLLATGVLSRIRSTLGVSLPLRTTFESPTIRELAEQVETVLWAMSGIPASSAESGEREEIEL